MARIPPIVKRFHVTTDEGLRKILESRALKPYMNAQTMYDNNGMALRDENGHIIHEDRLRPVFTSTPSAKNDWSGNGRTRKLFIEFPKERYLQFKRTDVNPDYPSAVQRKGLGTPYNVMSVDRGGYADLFMEDIPLEFVKKICLDGNRDCYDVETLLKEYVK